MIAIILSYLKQINLNKHFKFKNQRLILRGDRERKRLTCIISKEALRLISLSLFDFRKSSIKSEAGNKKTSVQIPFPDHCL